MTAVVRSKVFRYSTSEPESLFSANQSASASASLSGTSSPIASASSMIVAGRTPPSRWSCSDTFGRLRIETSVEDGVAVLVDGHVVLLGRSAGAVSVVRDVRERMPSAVRR